MEDFEIESKKAKIENLTCTAYSRLQEADELICELVNAGAIEKYEQNKIYNIILQLKNILDV